MIDVTSVQHVGGLRLQLGFEDGTQGVADLNDELVGTLSVLRDDAERFAAAFVDGGTVCWPGGLDPAPSRLYALAHALPIPQSFEDEAANERVVSLRELRKLAGVTPFLPPSRTRIRTIAGPRELLRACQQSPVAVTPSTSRP